MAGESAHFSPRERPPMHPMKHSDDSRAPQHRGEIPMAAPRIVGLDHVVLRVSDLERARKFYCDVLGALSLIHI